VTAASTVTLHGTNSNGKSALRELIAAGLIDVQVVVALCRKSHPVGPRPQHAAHHGYPVEPVRQTRIAIERRGQIRLHAEWWPPPIREMQPTRSR
jgi:hypothetical protein